MDATGAFGDRMLNHPNPKALLEHTLETAEAALLWQAKQSRTRLFKRRICFLFVPGIGDQTPESAKHRVPMGAGREKPGNSY